MSVDLVVEIAWVADNFLVRRVDTVAVAVEDNLVGDQQIASGLAASPEDTGEQRIASGLAEAPKNTGGDLEIASLAEALSLPGDFFEELALHIFLPC